MKNAGLISIFMGFFVTGQIHAASKDNECTLEQVKAYLTVSGIGQQIEQVEQQFHKSNELMKKTCLEQIQGDIELEQVVHKYFDDLGRLNVDRTKIIEQLVREMFTANELKEIISFYQSDIGQKSISFNSAFLLRLTQESQSLKDYVLKEGPKLQQKISKQAKKS